MNNYSFVVLDDEEIALVGISGAVIKAFRDLGTTAYCDTFLEPDSLLQAMKTKKYDALFLDISMPKIDGITLSEKIRSSGNSTLPIIFVSSREDKVFDSFATHPFGFIRKSRFGNDIKEVAERFLDEHPQHGLSSAIEISYKGVILHLNTDEVMYIESQKDYQYIYLLDKEDPEKIRLSMEIVEDKLKDRGFIRVHKGYLVNYIFIRRIDAMEVTLTNGTRIPLSRRKAQETRAKYLDLERNKGSVQLH